MQLANQTAPHPAAFVSFGDEGIEWPSCDESEKTEVIVITRVLLLMEKSVERSAWQGTCRPEVNLWG